MVRLERLSSPESCWWASSASILCSVNPISIWAVVVDKKPVEDAIKATQAACQAIYDKYK